jgi:hypothetical protein
LQKVILDQSALDDFLGYVIFGDLINNDRFFVVKIHGLALWAFYLYLRTIPDLGQQSVTKLASEFF